MTMPRLLKSFVVGCINSQKLLRLDGAHYQAIWQGCNLNRRDGKLANHLYPGKSHLISFAQEQGTITGLSLISIASKNKWSWSLMGTCNLAQALFLPM